MTNKLFLLVPILVCVGLVHSGCDPNRGCTDPYSDNFDPEATEDDDTCIPTRLKFVGDYDCNGTSHVGDNVLTSYDQVGLNITDETANDPEQLILGITNFDEAIYALTLRVVSQYGLSIPNQTIGAYTYSGDGNINGRVLELQYRRIETIELEPEVFDYDTIYLNLYGIQELEE